MFKLYHSQHESIKTLFRLNSDVHSYITGHKYSLRSFRGNHELYIIHFLFKLYIFRMKFLDVLVFPKFRKISKAYISVSSFNDET